MPKKEVEKNTEKTKQLTLNLESTEKQSNEPEVNHSSLLALLPQKTTKEYIREKSIINKIVKLGFSLSQIYECWNYYKESRSKEFDSYRIFLWQNGKLIYEALAFIKQIKENKEQDFRKNKEYKKVKNPIDYLR